MVIIITGILCTTLLGDPFKFGDQCCIKYLPTQEYLAVINEQKVIQFIICTH